jgi:hypothetical protein
LQKLLLPVDKPRYLNLNSYYLDVPKFIEHFRENNFTGCIHFRSHQAEAVLYFDQDEMLSAFFFDQNGSESGEEAVSALSGATKNGNFLISVYDVDQQSIYFWANLATAEPLYKDLNAEFTDLEGLIKKMSSEKLIGYIEVSLPGNQGGFILFQNGILLTQAYRWSGDALMPAPQGIQPLILKSRESGGSFHVKRVTPETQKSREQSISEALRMLEGLLQITEDVVGSNRKYRNKFDTLLKKKFLEKSDSFACLDPFLCEFQYENRKARFTGEVSPGELIRGIFESISELAVELGVARQLNEQLSQWTTRYSKKIRSAGVAYFQSLVPSS